MTIPDIIKYLEDFGIHVERKTVYDDIDTLRTFGMDIINRREKPSGYYLAHRRFQPLELSFLVGAVRTSGFIDDERTKQLIGKLESLASVHEAKRIRESVYLTDLQAQHGDESVYEAVGEINKAISLNRQLSFCYCQWTAAKELSLKKDGERYLVSPWGQLWKDGCYYMIALDEKSSIVKHYRVDRMRELRIEKQARNGEEIFKETDPVQFAVDNFVVFGGREEAVTLEFENRFVSQVIDRFGRDIPVINKDEEHFTTRVRVNTGRAFLSWIASLGFGVQILGPVKVKESYKRFLETALIEAERNENGTGGHRRKRRMIGPVPGRGIEGMNRG